jgi:beta-glucosidase
MAFARDMLWGAATAAYQIEGAWDADGKVPSVWDMFCRKPGAVKGEQSGDLACDHYNRWREDVAMMRDLGLGAYRFSVAWTRFLDEDGRPVEAGLDFYGRLVDALLEAGIEPMITLFHWDYPLHLFRRGGWASPDSPGWFADYAQLAGRRLGDRVRWWITHNEPSIPLVLGHFTGELAPGVRLPLGEVLRMLHHMLLAHGVATQALRAACPQTVKIGLTPAFAPGVPETADDLDAAREMTWRGPDLGCACWYTDPVYLGRYPDESQLAEAPGEAREFVAGVPASDLETIRQPLDYCALNTYSGFRVRRGPVRVPYEHGHPGGTLPWLWYEPSALYWAARWMHERYALPVAVTENGFCNLDWIGHDGRVRDPQRIDYLRGSLLGLRRAAAEGVPVLGYYQWSLMDNFEWAEGYAPRFGMVHVDYATQVRTLKESAYWYRRVIETNGASLDEPWSG